MYGGHGRGWRHRRLYYSTGVPGLGRGRCPRWYPSQAPADMAHPGPVPGPWSGDGPAGPEVSREEEMRMLEEEEQMLRQELEDLTKVIEELRNKEKEVNK